MIKNIQKQNFQIKEVVFNGVTLVGIQDNESGKIFVSIKKICDDLGIDTGSQKKRIKRDKFLSKGMQVIMTPNSNYGNKELFCLDIEFLPSFLTGIKDEKCKPEIQDSLIEFKLKAKDILAKAFLPGIKSEPELKTDPNTNLVDLDVLSATIAHIKSLTTKVDGLVKYRELGQKQLSEVERSEMLPLEAATRKKIYRLVQSYIQATGCDYSEPWHRIDREMYDRYSIDIPARRKSRKKDRLDIV